jgi:hypothetical protein
VIPARQKWRRDIAVVANQSKPIRPIYQGSLHDSCAFTLLTPLQNVLISTCGECRNDTVDSQSRMIFDCAY